MDKRGERVSRFSIESFLSYKAELFRRGILYCCSNVGYRKCLDKKGGVSRFYVENFLSHIAEKFRRGIFYCCSNLGYREGLDKRREEESIYSFENFLSHSDRKISVRQSFVALISGTEEVWRRGGYQDFPSKIFCLTVPKISVVESLDVALFFGCEKVFGQNRGGEYQDFPLENFCLTVPKISLRNTLLLD